MSNLTKLKKLYEEIAELTKPKCSGSCNVPQSCCSPEYCEMAIIIAEKEYGIKLEKTSHERLPLMGLGGCIAEPYLRPLCSLHICEGTLYRSGSAFLHKYFSIREDINEEEFVVKYKDKPRDTGI